MNVVRGLPPGHADAREERACHYAYSIIRAAVLRDGVVTYIVSDERDLLEVNPKHHRPEYRVTIVDRQP